MPTVLVGALSIDGSTAWGVVKEAMIYAPTSSAATSAENHPIGSLATLLWLHVLCANITVSWSYYFPRGHCDDPAGTFCDAGRAGPCACPV
ncbi:ArsB/NhaD family transporter [Pantoea sp. LMR881]|uniref:ArsB/NhaD family transporter n=1 Tax=Pantoea sp. LMR881 TaxID=3014336 RepID=UPI0022AF1743|nr:ArsB/NhaD family transporter [Pantoea sp. LMR881]MCZ4060949.1 ArsB/NhaD family transporter [Pantoea sp. LMR881]